jgi:hypothetical protein
MAGTELGVTHNGSGHPGIAVNALIMRGGVSYVNIPSTNELANPTKLWQSPYNAERQ